MPQVAQSGAAAAFDEGLYLGSGGVRAGVVDDDHLGEARSRHARVRLRDEPADVARLVQRRNDDGDAHHVPLSHRQSRDPSCIKAPRPEGYQSSGRAFNLVNA